MRSIRPSGGGVPRSPIFQYRATAKRLRERSFVAARSRKPPIRIGASGRRICLPSRQPSESPRPNPSPLPLREGEPERGKRIGRFAFMITGGLLPALPVRAPFPGPLSRWRERVDGAVVAPDLRDNCARRVRAGGPTCAAFGPTVAESHALRSSSTERPRRVFAKPASPRVICA